jgi:hypothetical protein
VEGCCENGNEFSGSITFWRSSRIAVHLAAFQHWLNYIKLVMVMYDCNYSWFMWGALVVRGKEFTKKTKT